MKCVLMRDECDDRRAYAAVLLDYKRLWFLEQLSKLGRPLRLYVRCFVVDVYAGQAACWPPCQLRQVQLLALSQHMCASSTSISCREGSEIAENAGPRGMFH